MVISPLWPEILVRRLVAASMRLLPWVGKAGFDPLLRQPLMAGRLFMKL
jgi:hypothetical protein